MSDGDAEPTWLADLAESSAYPPEAGAIGGVLRIDTHISHVFLTTTRAYKFRRPVRLPFLDFSSAEERLADCLRELHLNRRLAADVYLGLAPVLVSAGKIRIGPVGETPSTDPRAVEHGVVMRRLRAGRDLRSMIERGEAGVAHADRIAARLAHFHAEHSLGRPAPFLAAEWLETTTGPARANYDALAQAPSSLAPPREVEETRALAECFLRERRDDFEERRRAGRVVDGHGDLHAEHVWFEEEESQPLMIDCLEFRDDFRRIDAASDVAFLAMDLTYRGRSDLAARFLRRYARDSGDYQMFAVIDYFLSYRALVRAKVACLVAVDESLAEDQRAHATQSVRHHLELGLGFLKSRPASISGVNARFACGLVLTCGTIGTGKTTVAEALADATGGVVISSDRLRRNADSPSTTVVTGGQTGATYGQDRYSESARAAVYDRLLAEARHVVLSGRCAILDATWSRKQWRDVAADWARLHACDCMLLEVVARRDDVIARLAARAAEGNDASEAGPGLYDAMRAEFEEATEWPEIRKARIDTSSADWREQVADAAKRFGLA